MFRTTKETNYTIKNGEHIYTQISFMKMSRGEKYTLAIQKRFNPINNIIRERFFKERTVVGVTKTILGKSTNKEPWLIKKLDGNYELETVNVDYKKFEEPFYYNPSFSENNIEEFSQNELKNIFNIGNENDFFNLRGGEPQLFQEGDTGDYLDTYFTNSFFIEEPEELETLERIGNIQVITEIDYLN
jgi:hypothetical protein